MTAGCKEEQVGYQQVTEIFLKHETRRQKTLVCYN